MVDEILNFFSGEMLQLLPVILKYGSVTSSETTVRHLELV